MALRGRRDFLVGGGLAIGAFATQGCTKPLAVPAVAAAALPAASPTSGTQVAAFGWEATNLRGNGANTYVQVMSNMVLESVNADISASVTNAGGAGFAEILCCGGVSRQAAPSFSNASQVYINFPTSSNFGAVTAENPHNLTLFVEGAMMQDQFLAVILKSWVPSDGAASATSRHVLVYPSLSLTAGDYLVFHMDHYGVGLDAEMQVVLRYTLT